MKAKAILVISICLLGALATAPAARAEDPFGRLDGKAGGGNAGSGVIPIVGWALDDNGVRAVDIFVDGMPAGRAHYGRNRPGVTRRFAGFPDADAAGFAMRLDTTRYLNGLHRVEARVTSEVGERRFLNPVLLEFTNTQHLLDPFGEIEFPRPAAELYGTCDMAATPRRKSAVLGWVLDAGVEIGDMGVGYVELLIDGVIFANSRTDCRFNSSGEVRGLTDCYGLRRLDIERLFPTLTNAPQAGFRFVMDIGSLIDLGFAEGAHALTIRSGDIGGTVAKVDEIPVSFLCDNRIGNEEGFGWIGRVRPLNIGDGVVQAVGWALDWEGVDRVLVYVDGKEVGVATYGFPTPMIAQKYPGYPDNPNAGWRLSFNSTQFSDGRHDLQAILVDQAGRTTLLGERSFVLDNVDD
jgi:N-acetylmuramoyl-L-alanine amidase